MSEYLVTVAIETDETQGNPGDWDWATLIDSPLPVGVVGSVDVTGLDPNVGIIRLLGRLGVPHEVCMNIELGGYHG
jgi:hypothetical protein